MKLLPSVHSWPDYNLALKIQHTDMTEKQIEPLAVLTKTNVQCRILVGFLFVCLSSTSYKEAILKIILVLPSQKGFSDQYCIIKLTFLLPLE